jgi:hypothetical protein
MYAGPVFPSAKAWTECFSFFFSSKKDTQFVGVNGTNRTLWLKSVRKKWRFGMKAAG